MDEPLRILPLDSAPNTSPLRARFNLAAALSVERKNVIGLPNSANQLVNAIKLAPRSVNRLDVMTIVITS